MFMDDIEQSGIKKAVSRLDRKWMLGERNEAEKWIKSTHKKEACGVCVK